MAEMDFDQTIKIKTPGSGMTIFNRYKLDRVLGRGGMGVVWLADDLKLERPVAMKFLPSLIGLDPAAVKELKTETRRGLELSHPHIVRIYDFVDDEDAAAISMEFVDGKTLSELRMAKEHGVFTVEDISKWLLGVCDALDYAHFQRKVVHRDLKPANIMLTTKDAVAKIADFGIARSLSDTMSRLSAAHIGTSGTLPYMSPQQAMGERPLPTDDVYSLGATLYELLSGKPPFYRGDLPTQINSKIPPSMLERRQELEIPTSDTIPKIWEDAIAACLHKEPSMRPSCAGALAEMVGLKPGTVTLRTAQTFTGGQLQKAPASKAPLIAAAAAIIAAAGSAVYYFKQPVVDSAPLVAQTSPENKPTAELPKPADKPKTNEPVVVAAPKTKEPEATPTPAQGTENPDPAPTVAAQMPTAPADAPPAPTTGTIPAITPPKPTVTLVPADDPAAAPGQPMAPTAPTVAAVPTLPAPSPAVPTTAPGTVTPPAVSGTMPLTPDPNGALAGALTPPPSAAVQPLVSDPPAGFWTLDQMYPTPPFTMYSESGRKQILYKTQSLLKEKGIYTSTVDGKEGKGTHNAIQLFQAKSGLRPTGLLDVPTLAALELTTMPDDPKWTPPASASSGSRSYSRRNTKEKEEPGFMERTGEKLKNFFR